MKMAIRIKNPLNLLTFYSSENFQNTSIHQEGNTLDLKKAFKDINIDYTEDKEYLEKEKFASSTLYYGVTSSTGLDKDWNKVNIDMIEYYNENNTIKEIINA